MRGIHVIAAVALACVALLSSQRTNAQDWPQWRGLNRDAKTTGFTSPPAWPKELMQKWKITVGEGVATPSLLGDKLYVFTREGGNEVIRCLDAASGKDQWSDKYAAQPATGAASSFPGPRCSPTVADGKVVTLGVRGTLSCYDAADGKKLWRKEDSAWPRFFVSSSPIICQGLCIAQLGGETSGGIFAYDLATGAEKWKWTGDGPAYGSPIQMTVAGTDAIVTLTNQNLVAVGIADGKLLWKSPYEAPRQGRNYNAATPLLDGTVLIFSGGGRGTKAVKLEKQGEAVTAKEVWSNENAVQFNTPVVKDGWLFGLSGSDSLFCINAQDGKTGWTSALEARGRLRGYGSIVDAGPVLMALTPAGQLMVFEPSGKEYKQLASYKVAAGDTFAYPVIAGNRVFIKDRDSVSLWTIG